MSGQHGDSREAFEAWRRVAEFNVPLGELNFSQWQHQQAKIEALEKERDALKQELKDIELERKEERE